jgi:protein phosphatase
MDTQVVVVVGLVVAVFALVMVMRELRAGRSAPTPPATSPQQAEPDLPEIAISVDHLQDDEVTGFGGVPILKVAPAEDEEGDEESALSITKALATFADDAAAEEPTNPNRLFFVFGAAHSDIGKRRRRNEDAFVSIPSHQLFAVADGMGSVEGGAIASSTALRTVASLFEQSDAPRPRKEIERLPPKAERLVGAIEAAHEAIRAAAARNKDLVGMGTTIVAVQFLERRGRAFIAHVGDSRCYRLRAGALTLLTHDHTLGARGVRGPAAAHLRRVLGVAPKTYVDVFCDAPKAGDRYLLCSDGLSKMLSDEQIAAVASGSGTPAELAQRLVDAANEAGGRDNVTAMLVKVSEKAPATTAPSAPQFGGAASAA